MVVGQEQLLSITPKDGIEMKLCRKCNNLLNTDSFWKNKNCSDGLQPYCKSCHYGAVKKNLEGPNRKKYLDLRKNRHLVKTHGITLEDYNKKLKSQGGVCAICFEPPKERALAVDHNHVTGNNRGLLCGNCNRAIGLLKDNPTIARSAADYLDNWY